MVKRAIITARLPRLDGRERPRSLISCGGLSLLERQLRQLARAGIEEVCVLALDFALEIGSALQSMKKIPSTVALVQNPKELMDLVRDGGDILFLDDALLVDDRILKAVIHNEASTVLATDTKAVAVGFRASENLLGADSTEHFVGIAKLPSALISAQAPNAPAGDFLTLLLQAANFEKDRVLFDISSLPLYLPDRRRDVPLLLHRVSEKEGAENGANALIAMAQKGTLDWPARFIHPFFENLITKALLNTPVTPNQVTLVTGVFGFGATYLFATGHMLIALAIALVLGVLDGVDGKLARTKMLTSRVGELEHILDKLVEYSWYFGIAFALQRQGSDATVYSLALLIMLFAWSEVVLSEFFRRLSGVQLDDAGDFERKFRLIGGRRNTFFWSVIPFAIMDMWLAAMWFLAIYSILTTFVMQWRFIVRVMDYTSSLSPIIARNFRDSAYFPDKKK
ncbi:MAG: CDP-alcohol phosphatidyltransferase family protein [Sphingomonadales bacterium]|jgi:phosphatidylglycerophosphate synthase